MLSETILDEYFFKYKQYKKYFESLILKERLLKVELFKKLDIPYSTYSRVDETVSSKTIETTSKLCKYFGINELNHANKDKYTKAVLKALYTFYYCSEDTKTPIEDLTECEKDNTYLNPIFMLLKILLQLREINRYDFSEYNFRLRITELEKFKTFYEDTIFEIAYGYIEILINNRSFDFSYDSEDKMEKSLIKYSHMVNAYNRGKYELVLYYYKETDYILTNFCNFKRLIYSKIFYYSALNNLGEYQQVYKLSLSQILFLLAQKKEDQLFKATFIIHLTSLLGLGEYDKIISIYEKHTNLPVLYFFVLIAAYKLDRMDYYDDIYNKAIKEKGIFTDAILLLNSYCRDNKKMNKDDLDRIKLTPALIKIIRRKK